MAAGDDALDLLRSIDGTLKAMLALAQKRDARVQASQPKPVASDRDLDGRYGDPVIKFDPRDWTGASFKGARMSECPPEYLDLVAETFDYFARKAEENNERTDKGKAVADYKRQDAARARGWAKRHRDRGTVFPERQAPASAGSEASSVGDSGWAEDARPDGW